MMRRAEVLQRLLDTMYTADHKTLHNVAAVLVDIGVIERDPDPEPDHNLIVLDSTGRMWRNAGGYWHYDSASGGYNWDTVSLRGPHAHYSADQR